MTLRIAVLLVSVTAFTSSALAHSWYSKRTDPIYSTTTCCGGSDCAPLPSSSMTITPSGDLRITLSLEQAQQINPGRIEPFDEVIPHERIQTSEDGQPHICLMRMNRDQRQGFYCVFLPPQG